MLCWSDWPWAPAVIILTGVGFRTHFCDSMGLAVQTRGRPTTPSFAGCKTLLGMTKADGCWRRGASSRSEQSGNENHGMRHPGMKHRGPAPAMDACCANGRTGSFSVAGRLARPALSVCGLSTTRPVRFPKVRLARAFLRRAESNIAASWNRIANSSANYQTWIRRPRIESTVWRSIILCCHGSIGGLPSAAT